MTALIGAVFIASLLGSLHCAGMCGAFLAFAVAPPEAGPQPRRGALLAAYNAGRLATYLALGAVSGLLGAAVDLGGSAAGVHRAAAAAAGALMIAFGAAAVLRIAGARLPHAPVPAPLLRLARAGHARAALLPPASRAMAVGLLTTLLPCGWLYAFAVTAAGTADPLLGAATMAVFWAGTLPVMAGLGLVLQRATGALRRFMPLATSLLLVLVGVGTILFRAGAPAMAGALPTPSGPADAAAHLRTLDHADLPCCADDAR